MRRSIDFVNASLRKKLGGEPVLSIREACDAADDVRREALQEAISIAENSASLGSAILAIRRLAEERPSGGANDG